MIYVKKISIHANICRCMDGTEGLNILIQDGTRIKCSLRVSLLLVQALAFLSLGRG